jgi:exo-beta-1,3-glucanase (GH17 family)
VHRRRSRPARRALLLLACALALAASPDGAGRLPSAAPAAAPRYLPLAPGQASLERAPPTPLQQNTERLIARLDRLTWVAYAPTGFDPRRGCPAGFPDEGSVRADLQTLRAHGFSGLITFASDCTLDEVPRIAAEVGFSGVVMGLFMLTPALAEEEIASAIAAAGHVDGYGMGNEGLTTCGGGSYDEAALVANAVRLRAATQKPVTTSEQIEDYLNGGACGRFLGAFGDWAFPIAHPFNNGIRQPAAGVGFTEGRFNEVVAAVPRYVFLKETGWPTGPASVDGASEANQAAYFRQLATRPVRYARFEAFDQPWKSGPAWEPVFGLFRADRSPRPLCASGCP